MKSFRHWAYMGCAKVNFNIFKNLLKVVIFFASFKKVSYE